MRLRTNVFLWVVVMMIGFCPVAQADNTVCSGAIFIVPDGSSHEGTFTAASQSRFFRFVAKANRSYVFMLENLSPTDIQPRVEDFQPLVSCAGPLIDPPAFGTPNKEPVSLTDGNTVGSLRGGIVVTSATDAFFPVGGGVNGGRFRLRIVETTQFNPRWSTFGGFATQWGFQNTTTVQLTGTLTVLKTDGTVLATDTFVIPANGRAVFKVSTTLGIAADQAGSAIFTHNGPPGAVLADAFLVSSDLTVVVPAKFEPARQQR